MTKDTRLRDLQSSRLLRLVRILFPESRVTVDDEGLPVYEYPRRTGAGRRRNPVAMGILGLKATRLVSLVGLPEFDTTGDDVLAQISVENMAQWLLASSEDRGTYMVYHCDFPWPMYLLRPPWRSCLAEAFCGMFLTGYGTAKGDKRYVECGTKHLKSLAVPVSKGGVKADNSSVLFEYVDYERERRWPIVLNGHLYSVVTMYNAWTIFGIPELRATFKQAVSELETLLPMFEGPFFTYYDDYGNPATPFYHRIHIHLLDTLYELTNLTYLHATANRWRALMLRYNFPLSLLMRVYTGHLPYVPKR